MVPEQKSEHLEAPARTARDWLVRLKSGEATQDDLRTLARWRAACETHESSYQAELRMWRTLGPVLAAHGGQVSVHPVLDMRRQMVSRRGMLGGGAALAASVAVGGLFLGGTPKPAGATVLETAKGERRHVRLDRGLDVELNTASRAYYWREDSRLELERGELLVSVAYSGGNVLRVVAPSLQANAGQARFILRRLDETTDVACLGGTVMVESAERRYALAAGNTLVVGDGEAERVEADPGPPDTAWQRGLFVFRDRPAGEVVKEVNRYRAGHIYLPGDRASQRISGVIHLDRVDLAVDHIARSLDMKVIHLPGGVAILRG